MNTINEKLLDLKERKLFKLPLVLEGANEAVVSIDGKKVINLSSNNYLGFANHPKLIEASKKALDKYGVGSGAVRTIVGNMDIHEELDRRLAKFKREEAALVFQSGYMCNVGVIQAVVGRGDLIISDELNHASIIDGVRLSRAEKAIFKHSDMEDLENILKEKRHLYKDVLIIMICFNGWFSELPEIVKLAKNITL